jgi:hypothetical protein
MSIDFIYGQFILNNLMPKDGHNNWALGSENWKLDFQKFFSSYLKSKEKLWDFKSSKTTDRGVSN